MKNKKVSIIAGLFIITIITIIIAGIIEFSGYSEDDWAKTNIGNSEAIFGDGTYQVQKFYILDHYECILRKVTNPAESYMFVDKYIVKDHIAYLIGRDRETNNAEFVILDYYNNIVIEKSSLKDFSDEQQEIFQNSYFINVYPEMKKIRNNFFD